MRQAEFRIVAPGGGELPLPDAATWTLSPFRDGTGTISLTYPKGGRNFGALHAYVTGERDAEVRVAIDGRDRPDLSAILSEAQGDDADPAATWTFSGRFLVQYLDEAVVYPDPDAGTVQADGSTADAEREFSSMNGGQIISMLVAEAQARGALQYVTATSFNGSHDSNGQPWSRQTTTTCSPGVTLLSLLTTLHDQGLLEWQMYGADLRVYNLGSLGRDLTVGAAPVILHGPRDLTSSQRSYTAKDAVTHLLAAGQNGLYTEADDPSATARRGRRIEGYYSAGNIQDPGTLAAYAANQLEQVSDGTYQVSHGLAMGTGPMPPEDFDVWDWVYSDTGNGLEKFQVYQWSVSSDANGVLTGTVSLNDFIASRAAKLQREIAGITNGSVVVGTSLPSSGIDTVPPEPPDGLIVTSLAYLDPLGNTQAQVTAGWNPPVLSTDGTLANDLATYTVRWRYVHGTATQWTELPPVQAGLGTATGSWSPVDPGVQIEVQVRAADQAGNYSDWSDGAYIVTAFDDVPPPVPSTPVVSSYLGQLRIDWDGLGSSGEAMPPDFARTEVHVSAIDGFTPDSSTLAGQLIGGGTVIASGLTVGQVYFARMVSVDRTGNRSVPSAEASGTPQPIGLADISFKDQGNLIEDGSFEQAGMRAARAPLTGGPFTFVTSRAQAGTWSLQCDSAVQPGTLRTFSLGPLLPVAYDTQYRVRFFALAEDSGAGVPVPDGTVQLTARFYDDHQGFLYEIPVSANAQTAGISADWADIEADAPPDPEDPAYLAAYMDFAVELAPDGTHGKWWIDSCEVRAMIGTAIIRDAAITTEKVSELDAGVLKAGSITALQLSTGAVTAGQIAAGAIDGMSINAAVITGAQINGGTITASDFILEPGTANAILSYSNVLPGVNTQFLFGTTGSWKVPNSVTAVTVECWAGGGGGGGGGLGWTPSGFTGAYGGGAGGGGGGYIRATVPVTTGQTCTYAIGGAGEYGEGSAPPDSTAETGHAGGNTTFTAGSITVTAFGGHGGGGGMLGATPGAGGSGSVSGSGATAVQVFNGGSGGHNDSSTGNAGSGGGGGGSGGSQAAGRTGSTPGDNTQGIGAAAVTEGGPGGNGLWVEPDGSGPGGGTNGGFPGGGGGGGVGYTWVNDPNSPNAPTWYFSGTWGNNGQLRISYTVGSAGAALTESISPQAAVDSQGNNVLDGVTAYGPSGSYIQLTTNQGSDTPSLKFNPTNFSGGLPPSVTSFTQSYSVSGGSSEYQYVLEMLAASPNGFTGAGLQLQSDSSGGTYLGTARMGYRKASDGSFTTWMSWWQNGIQCYLPLKATAPDNSQEDWHPVAPSGSWTVSSCRYKLYPDATVSIAATLIATAAFSTGAQIMTMPAGYRPQSNQNLAITYGSSALEAANLSVNTAGAVKLWPGEANGTQVNIAVRFPID